MKMTLGLQEQTLRRRRGITALASAPGPVMKTKSIFRGDVLSPNSARHVSENVQYYTVYSRMSIRLGWENLVK